MAPQFHTRSICLGPLDGDFMITAFASCLPALETMGSGEMWGPKVGPGSHKQMEKWVKDAVASQDSTGTGGEGSPITRFCIAEVDVTSAEGAQWDTDAKVVVKAVDLGLGDGPVSKPLHYRDENEGQKKWLKVAGTVVHQNWIPPYIIQEPQFADTLREAKDKGNSLYIEFMVSDWRTSDERRKGAGAVLVQEVVKDAKSRGIKTIFVDCWGGNGGKLVKFYESHGFTVLGDWWGIREGHPPWPGKFLKLDL